MTVGDPCFAFLGLARNCAGTLPGFLTLLDELCAEGSGAFAIIGENGSRDDTRSLLEGADRAGTIKFVPTEFMAREPDRLRRMALGRECLKRELDAARWRPCFVCVADLDSVLARPPSIAALFRAAAKLSRPGVVGVSATSRPHYYDLLAYRDDDLQFDWLLGELGDARQNLFTYRRLFRSRIYPHQDALTTDREIVCLSAFNGLCIYKAQTYRTGSYLDDGPSRCEHVTFNRSILRDAGDHLLVDPQLVLATPEDHRQEGFVSFVWRRIRRRLSQS